MAFLLDTCTLSEMVTVRPDTNVLNWFGAQDDRDLYVSVITIGELERGIYQMPASRKRVQLEAWCFDKLIPSFQGRIISIDRKLITTWAKMVAELKVKGLARPSFDSLLEATAFENDLIFVTRNVRNFVDSSVTILNPWEE